METDEKKEDRLPCGMKAEFTNFKFDDKPGSSSSSSNKQQQRQEREQRLPNGQRAQFNNFSFDDKPAAQATSSTATKAEMFPFKDFKFPEKKETAPQQQQPQSSKVSSEKKNTAAAALPSVIVPANRDVKVYDNSTGPTANVLDNLGDEFFEGKMK